MNKSWNATKVPAMMSAGFKASNTARRVLMRVAGPAPSLSMRRLSAYSLELKDHWKMSEKMTASMQVMNEGMPKLRSL